MQRLRFFLARLTSGYPVVSLQSLGLWRILLGLTCSRFVVHRWGMLEVFYAGSGAYPIEALADKPSWSIGPLQWVSSAGALHVVFALSLLLTLAFTLGVFTRVTKFLLLPVLASLDARTPALFTGGELVLHLQALYAWLFPLGRAFSVDAWLSKRAGKSAAGTTAIWSLAYPLVLLQLAVIYAFNTLSKYGAFWKDGTAVARTLGAATLVTDFGSWVASLPMALQRALTFGTLVMEGLLPFLLLSPWRRRATHALAGLLIVSLHGGIWLALEVGSFSLAMISHVPLLWHPRDEARAIERPAKRHRRVEGVAVALLVYLLVARIGRDVATFPELPRAPLPLIVADFTYAMGLRQPWMMFSPNPPERDFVIVTDAVTRGGRHFDPWRDVASGQSEPFKELPTSVVREHAFTRYENALSQRAHTKMHPFFTRWVLAQRWGDDPVERFDAWLMVISTEPGSVVPVEQLDALVGVQPLPLTGALPIVSFAARGVWTPERALDGKIVPDGTHVFTPVSATMSGGCPTLTLDLGEPKAVQSAFLQADAADRFFIEGSLDGGGFHALGEMPALQLRQHKSRVIALPREPVRFVRLRPARSRGFRHILSEVALFEQAIALPAVPAHPRPIESWYTSLARPTVVGIISGTNHPTPDCPAEDPSSRP